MPRLKKGKSPFTKKTGPCDHEESKGTVCRTCLQKDGNLSNITQTVLERVKKLVWQDYSLENSPLPKVICFICRTKLCRLTQVTYIMNIIYFRYILQDSSAKTQSQR